MQAASPVMRIPVLRCHWHQPDVALDGAMGNPGVAGKAYLNGMDSSPTEP